MAIGGLVVSDFVRDRDSDTGVVVERLTNPRHTCHLLNTRMRSTSADGTVLVYAAEYGESRQIWAMNLLTGVSVQLTSGRGISEYSGVVLDNDDRHVIYIQDNALWSIDLTTLLRTKLYASPKGWLPKNISIAPEGSTVALVEYEETLVPVNLEQADWSHFALSAIAGPHCRVVCIERPSLEVREVADERAWIGGTLQRPGDGDTVLYCHEGPYDYIDARMWVGRADGSEPVRVRGAKSRDEIVTQEFWLPGGAGVGFLHWREGDGAAAIRAIDGATGEERTLMRCRAYAHLSASPDGRWCVGDAAGTAEPIHLRGTDADAAYAAQGIEPDDHIYLCDLEHGREVALCRHATSWSPKWGTVQDTHPHPQFSSDGRHVYFVSDRDGHPAIYRVCLAEFLWLRDGGKGPVGPYDPQRPDATWGFPATFARR